MNSVQILAAPEDFTTEAVLACERDQITWIKPAPHRIPPSEKEPHPPQNAGSARGVPGGGQLPEEISRTVRLAGRTGNHERGVRTHHRSYVLQKLVHHTVVKELNHPDRDDQVILPLIPIGRTITTYQVRPGVPSPKALEHGRRKIHAAIFHLIKAKRRVKVPVTATNIQHSFGRCVRKQCS